MAMQHNLSKAVQFDPMIPYTAAGITVISSTGIDMSGFEGVQFVALLGNITTANITNLHIEMSTALTGTYVDCLASAAFFASTQASSGPYLISEIYRPIKRYVRAVVDRSAGGGVANSVIHGVWANRFRPSFLPVAESTETGVVIDYAITYSPTSGSAT